MSKRGIFSFILLFLIFSSLPSARVSAKPSTVVISVFIMNVEKVDLTESKHRIDFYLMFEFDSSEISLDDIRNFQFVNGEPSMRELEVGIDGSQASIVYRVRGDFVTAFKLGRYPFDSHNIEIFIDLPLINIEHNFETNMFSVDTMVIVGWDYEGIESRVEERFYAEE